MTALGHELNGRYRLEERLGSGGMGSVWKAHDLLLDRTVALKELVPQHADIEDLARRRERARNEARMLAKVEHPAIVSIHDLLSVDGDPWIVMGYFSGRSLDKIIRDDPVLDEQEVASIGLPVLHGLMAAHASGVVHRDVKPANILVAKDRSICLVDFGIAKVVGEPTTSGIVLGTVEYLSPERLDGRSGGPPSDLWSLGVTLYYALERRSPFGAGTIEATIGTILHKEPPEPKRRGALAGIVMRMLRKNPASRPEAAVVAAVLRSVLSRGLPASRPWWYRPDSSDGPPVRPVRESRVQPGSAAPGPVAPAVSGMPIADAVEIVNRSATGSGVATLLQMSDRQAARILDRCACSVAGELIGGIAAEQPRRAGKILEIVAADRAGRVLGHMSHDAAAAVLLTIPLAAGARLLRECDGRTAASALTAMPPKRASQLVQAMERNRVADMLGHAPPASVAAILTVVPDELRKKLLQRFPAQFGALVRRYM